MKEFSKEGEKSKQRTCNIALALVRSMIRASDADTPMSCLPQGQAALPCCCPMSRDSHLCLAPCCTNAICKSLGHASSTVWETCQRGSYIFGLHLIGLRNIWVQPIAASEPTMECIIRPDITTTETCQAVAHLWLSPRATELMSHACPRQSCTLWAISSPGSC